MPRYFFNLVGSETVTDLEGTELPSLDDAREEAMRDARGIMSHAVLAGHDVSSRQIEIRNEDGLLLAVVQFSETVSKKF